ncbi:hypothetical protein BROWWM01_80130 [Bradyrhizobium ottawaense]
MPLLLDRRGALLGLDLCGEPNCGDAVAGALLPALCESAIAGKIEIVAALAGTDLGALRQFDRWPYRDRRWRRWIKLMVVTAEIGSEGRDAKAKAG